MSQDKIKVPPDEPRYTLKRIWLTEKEIAGYYNGYSNSAILPLCLLAHVRPEFSKQDWSVYEKVNGKFAAVLAGRNKKYPKTDYSYSGLSFCAIASYDKKEPAGRRDRIILAYSLAKRPDVQYLPATQGNIRRHAWG